MSGTTMTEMNLDQVAGGTCQLALVREMLHHGRKLDLLTEFGWSRILRIAPRIVGERPRHGIRYIMCADGSPDGFAVRAGLSETVWCRIARTAKGVKI